MEAQRAKSKVESEANPLYAGIYKKLPVSSVKQEKDFINAMSPKKSGRW